MHSTIVSLTYVILAFVEIVGLGSSRPVEAVILAASVAFVGVPHGAFDHVVGQRILRPILGNLWSSVFFVSYLVIASCVVMGWYEWPMGTVLAFFLVSAWHFGVEECETNQLQWFSHLLAVASGGIVIWLPALIRRSDIIELLTLVLPDGDEGVAAACASITAGAAVGLAPLTLVNAFKSISDLTRDEFSVRRLLASAILRTSALTLLCACVSPLVSFTVYFCFWHSIRGLIRIASTVRDNPLILALRLAPLTIMAIGLAVAGSSVWSSSEILSPTLIRTVFVGLSALAVPHLFLHVADAIIPRERQVMSF